MKYLSLLLSLFFAPLAVQTLHAHCQIPCGIYGDELKFGELEQHVATIEKASLMLNEISGKDELLAQDKQQLVRWTINKESHAQAIIDEVANYFLAQRIKPDADHYAEKVELLHHIIVYSMKAKQQASSEPAEMLAKKIAAFKALYLDHDHTHHHKH